MRRYKIELFMTNKMIIAIYHAKPINNTKLFIQNMQITRFNNFAIKLHYGIVHSLNRLFL